MPFQVIGVMTKKGQSPMGQDYDDAVFIPVSTYRSKIQGGLINFIAGSIFVGASSPETTARAEREVRSLLRDRHHLAPDVDDDFQVRNLTEIATAQQEGTRTLTTLLASIAAVSLIVGGIGIMNIMLVSVTERTREIGDAHQHDVQDRKSTRLNSSHDQISYAVFCLKKKKRDNNR